MSGTSSFNKLNADADHEMYQVPLTAKPHLLLQMEYALGIREQHHIAETTRQS